MAFLFALFGAGVMSAAVFRDPAPLRVLLKRLAIVFPMCFWALSLLVHLIWDYQNRQRLTDFSWVLGLTVGALLLLWVGGFVALRWRARRAVIWEEARRLATPLVEFQQATMLLILLPLPLSGCYEAAHWLNTELDSSSPKLVQARVAGADRPSTRNLASHHRLLFDIPELGLKDFPLRVSPGQYARARRHGRADPRARRLARLEVDGYGGARVAAGLVSRGGSGYHGSTMLKVVTCLLFSVLLPVPAAAFDEIHQSQVIIEEIWERPAVPAPSPVERIPQVGKEAASGIEEIAPPKGRVNLHMVQIWQTEGVRKVPLSADAKVGTVVVSSADVGKPKVFRVRVKPSARPYVLVLSSIMPLQWRVELQPGATLERILLRDSTFSGEHSEVVVEGAVKPRVERWNARMFNIYRAAPSRIELDRVEGKERPAVLRKYEMERKRTMAPELLELSAKFQARIEFQTRYIASEIEVGPCPEGAGTKQSYCR